MSESFQTSYDDPGAPACPDPLPLLDALVADVANHAPALAHSASAFITQTGQVFHLHAFIFRGPEAGGDLMRIGFFAGIHGDEPAGAIALMRFLSKLAANPEIATGYEIVALPICNPYGCSCRRRNSCSGHDLNREFWKGSAQPEVVILENILASQQFHGIVSLHSDDCSDGLYGFVDGATLARDLLEPALEAAERFLPRNQEPTIDSFEALNGILQQGYGGVLSAPPEIKPRPFEIVFETPERADCEAQIAAHMAAIEAILENYRSFIAHANSI